MMKLKDNGDGTYSTTTSKFVQVIQSHNAVSIRDTSNNDSSLIDVSVSENKSVYVHNGLNQTLSVQLLIYSPDGTQYYAVPSPKTITAGSSYLITTADFLLLNAPICKIKVRLFCTVSPTSGAASAWVQSY